MKTFSQVVLSRIVDPLWKFPPKGKHYGDADEDGDDDDEESEDEFPENPGNEKHL